MRFFTLFALLFCITGLHAQIEEEKTVVQTDSIAPVADPKYREDQFYAAIAYNLIQGKPSGYTQYSFSTALNVGFLRDMPINKARTHSIGLGLGYSYNNIKHNLVVTDVNGSNTYETRDQSTFDRNKLVLHYLELPLELRWRNSDSISHKFWRVYVGLKASYLFYDKAQYEQGSTVTKVTNDPNMNKLVYGTYLSVGWNTWNLYAYYSLTPIYDNVLMQNGQKLEMTSIKFGLIFYIL